VREKKKGFDSRPPASQVNSSQAQGMVTTGALRRPNLTLCQVGHARVIYLESKGVTKSKRWYGQSIPAPCDKACYRGSLFIRVRGVLAMLCYTLVMLGPAVLHASPSFKTFARARACHLISSVVRVLALFSKNRVAHSPSSDPSRNIFLSPPLRILA
jgi:hypothetical protein